MCSWFFFGSGNSCAKRCAKQVVPSATMTSPCNIYTIALQSISFLLVYQLTIGPALAYQDLSNSTRGCGIQTMATRQEKIVGGTEAEHGEFPFIVGIASVFRPRHFCGGSLISEFWVLTAAHCVHELTDNAGSLRVRVREFDLDGPEDPPGYLVKVEKIHVHEEFYLDAFTNDIALLRLAEPVSWDNYTTPICVPDPNSTYEFELATAAGWGRLAEFRLKTPGKLRKVLLHVIPPDFCMDWTEYEMTDHQFCAGFKHKSRDVCSGDSGGPLVLKEAGRYVVIGIVSYGDGCGRPRTPTVYTAVASFDDWIREIMDSYETHD